MEKDTSGQAFPTQETMDYHGCKGMTLRDYACIKLKVPETDKDWLNEIILKSKGDYFAGQVVVGLISGGFQYMQASGYLNQKDKDYAEHCYKVADAMIKEREKTE